MQQFDFTAWSLYTGPSHVKSVLNDGESPWSTGHWTGANEDYSVGEMQKDIDARIELFLRVFDQAIKDFKTYNRTFMAPEFFFRCKNGPYPYQKLEGDLYPFEYIESKIKTGLKKLIPKDNNYYSVVIGTVLTSNVVSMSSFLKSRAVNERQEMINEVLHHLAEQPSHIDLNLFFRNIRIPNVQISVDHLKINNAMIGYRANPLCTVRNRSIYFHYNGSMMDEPESFVIEKQSESSIDLTMGSMDGSGISHGGMVTEWLCNYPSYNTLYGDKQRGAFSTNARFQPAFIGNEDIGVEICLDHYLQRLRRSVGMTKANGASTDNFPLFKQLVPSGGMQLLDFAIAARSNGAIFNADGNSCIYYSNDSEIDDKGVIIPPRVLPTGIHSGVFCGVYSKAVQSEFKGKDGNTYYSHSQLAFTTSDSEVDSFNNASGINNNKARTYNGTIDAPYNAMTDCFTPRITPLTGNSELFAAGIGELHYYEPIN